MTSDVTINKETEISSSAAITKADIAVHDTRAMVMKVLSGQPSFQTYERRSIAGAILGKATE